MTLTWQLALGAAAFAAVGGGFVLWQVKQFDRRFPGRKPTDPAQTQAR